MRLAPNFARAPEGALRLFARPPEGALRLALLAVAILSGGCAGMRRSQALPQRALLAASEQPSLFLGPEPDAAQIGYVGPQVVLELTGEPALGRVPVRIDGPLRARGYVAVDQLQLRVQRRGRIRGAPVYVGPGDLVHVLGPDDAPGRLRVRAVPRLGGQPLPAHEGSFPSEGLAENPAPENAAAPDPGTLYRVPAQTPLPLSEAPKTEPFATLAAQPQAYEVRVVGAVDRWLAVRAGDGPYLIGWTETALLPGVPGASAASSPLPPLASTPATALPAQPTAGAPASTTDAVPARLLKDVGELRGVVAGAQLRFGAQVIGVFKRAGWARVLRVYDAGLVDAFVAVDDGLSLRGLLRTVDLVPTAAPAVRPPAEPAAPVSERSTPAATR